MFCVGSEIHFCRKFYVKLFNPCKDFQGENSFKSTKGVFASLSIQRSLKLALPPEITGNYFLKHFLKKKYSAIPPEMDPEYLKKLLNQKSNEDEDV